MGQPDNEFPGTAHGKSSPIRWDTTTATAALVLGALAFLIFVNYAFAGSVSASASVRR